jgi:hypothetical protein
VSPQPVVFKYAFLNLVVVRITERIRERGGRTQKAFWRLRLLARPGVTEKMSSANVTHAFVSTPREGKVSIFEERALNTASSPRTTRFFMGQPSEGFRRLIREKAGLPAAKAQDAEACLPCAMV